MDDTVRSRRTLYIVLVVLGLLFSCGIGLLMGGVAGYVTGRNSAINSLGRGFGGGMMPRFATPVPVIPGVPRTTPGAGTPAPTQGAVILSVVQGGPAAAAGLQRGDIILAVDNQVVDENNDLPTVLGKYKPGDTINLSIRRQSQDIQVPVQLGTNPNASATTPWLGIGYTMLTPGQ